MFGMVFRLATPQFCGCSGIHWQLSRYWGLPNTKVPCCSWSRIGSEFDGSQESRVTTCLMGWAPNRRYREQTRRLVDDEDRSVFNKMRIRSRSTGKPWHNLRAELDQRLGRRFNFQTAASAAEDDPIESDHTVIDIQRHSMRKGERRHTANLHSGERRHFFRRRE